MSNKHKKTLSPEASQKREARAFHRRIRKVFCDMGFTYIVTEGREFQLLLSAEDDGRACFCRTQRRYQALHADPYQRGCRNGRHLRL